MKTRFQNKEIAHVWANLTDAELDAGRSGAANSMRFEGEGFYSYQTCIARIYRRKGRSAVLMDAASYSPTTSAHQSRVRCAVPERLPVWSIHFGKRGQSLRFTPKELWSYACDEVKNHAESAATARGRAPLFLERAQAAVRTAEEIRQFFGLRNKPFAPDLSKLVEYAKRQEIARAKSIAQKAERERARKEAHENLSAKWGPRLLELWRQHQEDGNEYLGIKNEVQMRDLAPLNVSALIRGDSPFFQGNCALRLSLDRERVETNKGAQVLVRTVKFLWAFCSTARRLSASVAPATVAQFPRLDHYSVNEIDAGGNVTAGCHSIAFSEVEYIAKELGLPPFNGQPEEAPTIPQAEEVQA